MNDINNCNNETSEMFYEKARKEFSREHYRNAYELYSKGLEQGEIKCGFGVARCKEHGYGTTQDEEEAASLFEKYYQPILKLAEAGDMEAQTIMGDYAYNGYFVPEDEEKAINWYMDAANQGYDEAQFSLGCCYMDDEDDEDIGQLPKMAIGWFLEAAQQGHVLAQYNLGSYYKDQLHNEAIKWYKKAAQQGLIPAQIALAKLFYEDSLYEEAIKWYKKAVEQGCTLNFLHLIILTQIYNNRVNSVDVQEKLIKLLKKIAEQGNTKAQTELAKIYEDRGQYDDAVDCLAKAIEQGDTWAIQSLRVFYEKHHSAGIREKIKRFLTKIAEQGNTKAQTELAIIYEYEGLYDKAADCFAIATEKEPEVIDYLDENFNCYIRRYRLYKKHLEHLYNRESEQKKSDDNPEDAMTQYFCGADFFANGLYVEAVKWFEKSVDQGCPLAADMLGQIYEYGIGIPQNIDLAIKSYQQAIDLDLGVAARNLGMLLYKREDYLKAIGCFNKALRLGAEETEGEVYYYLGDCYHFHYNYGDRTQNLKKAEEYYQKAITKGYNCRYALQWVEKDIKLEEYFQEELQKIGNNNPNSTEKKEAKRRAEERYWLSPQQGGIQEYINELLQSNLDAKARKNKITRDLQKDFGSLWINGLKVNARKAIVTGLWEYSNFITLGKEDYEDLDFSTPINALSKAFEIELREFFFKGYITYLQDHYKPEEFVVREDNDEWLYPIIVFNKEKRKYEYREPDDMSFSLGSFFHLIKPKQKRNWGRTINDYVLEYAKILFSKDKFDDANSDEEIINYLLGISTDIATLKNSYRNPGTHEETMKYDQAAVAADYLVKVQKAIMRFIETIDPKYRKDGYNPQ